MINAGLFGGTFNPFHNGHLGIIEAVQKACSLDRIYLFPSANPPHKPADNLAPARDRLKMVEASIQDRPGLFASDIELRRKGPSFTIDTIEAFKTLHGPGIQFHLLMGTDAFLDIATWKAKDQIFAAVPIIILRRGIQSGVDTLSSFIDEHIAKGYTLENGQKFVHTHLQPIRICKVPRIDISSTMIRDRVRQGLPIDGLVPEHIKTLIQEKDLYK